MSAGEALRALVFRKLRRRREFGRSSGGMSRTRGEGRGEPGGVPARRLRVQSLAADFFFTGQMTWVRHLPKVLR